MTAYARLNGISVVEGRVGLPRRGTWTADLRLETNNAMAGACALGLGSVSFVGTVVACRVIRGSSHVRMVGGNGSLSAVLPPKAYFRTPVRVPLADIAAAVGEVVSPQAENAILAAQLGHWVRLEAQAAVALGRLVAAVPGATWRIRPDGRLWVGSESWPAAAVPHELTDYDAFDDRLVLYSAEPGFLPGTSFRGRHVSYVEHQVGQRNIATHLYLEAA